MCCNAIKNLSKTLYLKKICKNQLIFADLILFLKGGISMLLQTKPFLLKVFRK